MKRTVSLVLALLMLVCILGTVGCAQEEKEPENAIYVTIAKDGLRLARRAVSLKDADGDGKTTIADALMLAHEDSYEGGAAAGFAMEETEYGLSMTMLWGDESGAFGYCVNNASAMSLFDEVKVGDHVYAYVYSDRMTWSDSYSYFDVSLVETAAGEQMTLTLCCVGYGEDWMPVTSPVAGAVITVDGAASEYRTDEEGKVTLTLDKKGSYTISATSETMTLVPPVCIVRVK